MMISSPGVFEPLRSVDLFPTKNYLPSVDSLRALAVITVILYHLDEDLLPGGFKGVDVFFVISGYVISKSLRTLGDVSVTSFLLSFYRKRFIRILPALLFCLMFFSLLASFVVTEGFLSESIGGTGFYGFFGLSNFFLATRADAYFDASIPFNPFVHTWSLGVEEQFYLVYPILAFGIFHTHREHEWVRSVSALLFISISIASIFVAYSWTTRAPENAFYLIPARFWELSTGCVIFWLQYNGKIAITKVSGSLLLLLGMVFIAAGLASSSSGKFPFPDAALPVFGAAMLIVALTSRGSEILYETAAYKVITFKPVVFLGLISYSLYLWHWPIFSLMRWTVGLNQHYLSVMAIALTLAGALFSYFFIEKPIRYSGYVSSGKDFRVIAASLLAVSTFAFLTTHVFEKREELGLLNSVTAQNKCDWASWIPKGCQMPDLEFIPGVGSGKRLISVGDSHEGAYTRMLELYSQKSGSALHRYKITGCALIRVAPKWAVRPACEGKLLAFALDLVRPGDIVFLPGLRTNRLHDQYGPLSEAAVVAERDRRQSSAMLSKGYDHAIETITAIRDKGGIVVIEAPKPVFRASPDSCSDWFNQRSARCSGGFTVSRQFSEEHRLGVMQVLGRLDQISDVHLWDPPSRLV